MALIPIDDESHSAVEQFRSIRERDLVGRSAHFIAEGTVVLSHLLAAPRFEIESVLVSENRVSGLLERLPGLADTLPVHVAPAETMSRIAGFDIHRGVLALGRRKADVAATDIIAGLPSRALVLILVGIGNHDNIGSIFRNAAAFGADAVLLDRTCCHPLYRKAIRVSVGGVFKVPFAIIDDVDDFLARLRSTGFGILALSPSGAVDVRSVKPSDRQALLLGSEGDGLPMTILETVPSARIAMARGFDSLNVAAASAIALHALSDFG